MTKNHVLILDRGLFMMLTELATAALRNNYIIMIYKYTCTVGSGNLSLDLHRSWLK